jgi:hypothetical protein
MQAWQFDFHLLLDVLGAEFCHRGARLLFGEMRGLSLADPTVPSACWMYFKYSSLMPYPEILWSQLAKMPSGQTL